MLYIGITSHLEGRVRQHKEKQIDGYTSKYNVTKLVYFEEFQYVYDAIVREKQLKGWLRRKKDALISGMNPDWKDLSDGWYSTNESLY